MGSLVGKRALVTASGQGIGKAIAEELLRAGCDVAVHYFSDSTGAAEVVDLQLRWHHQFQFAGYYAALEKGFYKEEGLDVRIHAGDRQHDPHIRRADLAAQFAIQRANRLRHRGEFRDVARQSRPAGQGA